MFLETPIEVCPHYIRNRFLLYFNKTLWRYETAWYNSKERKKARAAGFYEIIIFR